MKFNILETSNKLNTYVFSVFANNDHQHMTLKVTYISSLLFVLFCLYNTSKVHAQDTPKIYDYTEKLTLEIGGVNIVGAENRDRNAIKSIAGFREGKKITIPGTDVSKAVKSLMKLRLFRDVQVQIDSIVNNEVVFLSLFLEDAPTLARYSFTGIKKSEEDELNDIVKTILTKDGIVSDDQKDLSKLRIREFFIGKGLLDAQVEVAEYADETRENSVRLEFLIEKNEKIKIGDIVFNGNEGISDRKLRKKMKNTKKKGTPLRKSKYIVKDFEEDKTNIVNYYNVRGYKNARIVSDSIWRDEDGNIAIAIEINEGNIFYIRDIKWKGNTLYKDDYLSAVLGINKGDIYNPELLEKRLRFSLDGRDISSLYLDDGYLGFNIDPVEIAIENDSIDLEMRIYEGPQFTVNNVVINGNDRTHEHVVRRELRTVPGKKFSRSDIIRSQREIINLGYFNPESLDIDTPVNQSQGTVDIIYSLEERPADQLELSAGYGGFSGLIGTLGVTFNNFSVRNLRDRSTWSPLPQGDGQRFSVRLQSNSRFFRSYNLSFTEPWLGGKRPRSFTIGAVQTAFDNTIFGGGKLSITRGFIGLGSQLKWPDDFFSSNTTLNLEVISMSEYSEQQGFGFRVEQNGRLLTINNGLFRNFNIRQVFARSSISDPLFPKSGSRIQLSIQFTPPYSLFRRQGDLDLTEDEKDRIVDRLRFERGPGNLPTETDIERAFEDTRLAKKFTWLEYHKWGFLSEWYFNLTGNLVLMSQAKFGFLGLYNREVGLPPFERFELGGDGLSNQNIGLIGRDIIAFRGYAVEDLPENRRGGGTIYNKITMELRYPVSLNPNSTIFGTTWLQAGNSWGRFADFNPFELRRAAGFGLRVFLPMFGLLGFDYGWGFDKNLPPGTPRGEYGQFNIIIGFEPE
jgi:outer membrane protein insertion porin family